MEINNDKKIYYIILFDYYKNCLTQKQQDIFNSYYNDDFSLSEIAIDLNVSRNAVWDTLKKVMAILENYEEKLRLYEKDLKLRKKLNELKLVSNEEGKKLIQEIEEME